MTQSLEAIETVYDGYRFRSRLEARWAVFFNTLGIKYEYEKEGYDLDGIWYLPDFWLPEQQCWVEIKGQEPTKEEKDKCILLAEGTGNPVFLFFNDVGPFDHRYDENTKRNLPLLGNAYKFIPHERDDYPAGYPQGGMLGWGECPVCHTLVISLFGIAGIRDANNLCFVSTQNDCNCSIDGLRPKEHHISQRLVEACVDARQARFEKGR